MPRLSALRLASLIGLLGSALVIIGFSLPSRFVTVVIPPAPATYSADSYSPDFSAKGSESSASSAWD
jgi:hypothetical protein